jgi:DNA-binding GntR family transcriptional regulator
MRALGDGDPAYADLNREFHFTVYEYAGSPLLLSLMRLLWASLQGSPSAGCQHDPIVAALRAGDEEAAAARTREHITG